MLHKLVCQSLLTLCRLCLSFFPVSILILLVVELGLLDLDLLIHFIKQVSHQSILVELFPLSKGFWCHVLSVWKWKALMRSGTENVIVHAWEKYISQFMKGATLTKGQKMIIFYQWADSILFTQNHFPFCYWIHQQKRIFSHGYASAGRSTGMLHWYQCDLVREGAWRLHV